MAAFLVKDIDRDRDGEAPREITYNQAHARLAKAASIAIAAGAGVATWAAFYSPEAGLLHGQVIPAMMGAVIGVGLGVAWHTMIGKAERVREIAEKTTIVLSGAVLFAVTATASSWQFTTNISGDAAQRQYYADQLTDKRQAFEAARGGAAIEAKVISVVEGAVGELRAMAQIERDGKLSPKGVGTGPNAKLLEAAADDQDQLAHRMQEKYDSGPDRWIARAENTLETLPAAIATAPSTVPEKIGTIEGTIARLNGFKLTDMASKGGIMEVTVWSHNSGDHAVVETINSGVDKVKKRVIDEAKRIEEDRKEALNAPEAKFTPFRPLEPREATLRYANGAAFGGWMLALGIDAVPYMLTLLILFTHDCPLLNLPIRLRKRRPNKSRYDGREDRSAA